MKIEGSRKTAEAPRSRGLSGRQGGYLRLSRSRIIRRQAAPRLSSNEHSAVAVMKCVDAERPATACVLTCHQRREVAVCAVLTTREGDETAATYRTRHGPGRVTRR